MLSWVLVVLFFLILHACRNDLNSFQQTIDRSILNTEQADSVTIIYSKEGITKARLFTRHFQHVQDAQPSYIDMKNGLHVVFYNDSGRIESSLWAKYGRYYEQNGNVLVRDSVVVRNQRQEQLNTEELIWNEKLQKFFTDKFVKITTPTQIIYGEGLESNQNFSDYTLLKVKGTLGVSSQQLPLP